jgi:two-component system phosphate regulon response regulator OmpR
MERAIPKRRPVDEARHILVVDDDRRIRELIRSYLMENGFLVSVAGTAAEARERMRGLTFDLLVLDIMMPGESGLALTTSLRSEGRDLPVLMLSALADTDDRIAGLATGSDDYLVKPFEPRELLLRIKNLLRRVRIEVPAKTDVRFGGFQFNVLRGELRRNGDLVRLTSSEKELLRMLCYKTGTPLSRLELSQPGSEESARSVDVQINRLRQKIESDPANPVYLQTVRGAGYALYVEEEVSG